MLFRSRSGERLKPVGVMGNPFCESPLFHGDGYGFGYLRIKIFVPMLYLLQFRKYFMRQILFHRVYVETIARKDIFNSMAGKVKGN